ncbi:MAG: AzlC family ABC transporter permease [Rectinema sp.]
MLRRTGRSALFSEALKATVPVMLGYLTLGLAFGLLASDSGLPWWLTLCMSLFMYAGAGQFALVGLLAAGGGPAEAAILSFAVNIRHAAYGVSMLGRFAPWPRLKPYLALSLTDETFALLSTLPQRGRDDGRFMGMVSALNQAWWVAGTMAGVFAGAILPWKLEGLDFALTALFVVLLVEQLRRVREPWPYVGAALSAVFGTLIAGPRAGMVIGLAGGMAAASIRRGPAARDSGSSAGNSDSGDRKEGRSGE